MSEQDVVDLGAFHEAQAALRDAERRVGEIIGGSYDFCSKCGRKRPDCGFYEPPSQGGGVFIPVCNDCHRKEQGQKPDDEAACPTGDKEGD